MIAPLHEAMLREYVGHHGAMRFVRETPLMFIPITNHRVSPSAGEPALVPSPARAGKSSEAA